MAFENPNANGRYIVSNKGLWFVDISKILQKHFPLIKFPQFELFNFITLIAALFDPRITTYQLWMTLGKKQQKIKSKK